MFYLVPVPKQFVDFSGVPYSGGSVTVYVHGTTDKAQIYAEADSNVLLNNPCQLDSNGSWKCFVPADIPLDYIVQDRDGNVVASYMNIVMPMIDTAVTKGYVDSQDQLRDKNFAADYDAAQAYLLLGTYVMHEGRLYKSAVVIDEPEEWNSDHWTECTVTDELDAKIAAETSRAQAAEASARTEVVEGENCTIEKTTAADGHDVYTVNADGKPQEQADWNQADSSKVDYIKNKPNLGLKADKVQGATAGNFAALDANGNLADSRKNAADFKTKQTAVTDPTADGNGLSFIDSVTQNENGEITPHKKSVQDGTTAQKGVVKLNNAINSTSTTEAATPKAVKDAYDDLNNKIVARATFLSPAEWAVQSQLPGDPAKVYYVEDGTGEDAYTVYVWKESTSEYVEVDESSIDLDGYWHDSPTTSGSGNVVTDISLGNDGVPQVVKGITALTQHQSVTDNNPTLAWGSTSTVGTVGSANLRVTMPSNPASGKQDAVSTDTDSSAFGDNTTIATGFGSSKFHLNIASRLWTYIQGKISSVLGLTASSYGGKAATAGTADSANSVAWTNVSNKPTKLSEFTDDITQQTYIASGTGSDKPASGAAVSQAVEQAITPVYLGLSTSVPWCRIARGTVGTWNSTAFVGKMFMRGYANATSVSTYLGRLIFSIFRQNDSTSFPTFWRLFVDFPLNISLAGFDACILHNDADYYELWVKNTTNESGFRISKEYAANFSFDPMDFEGKSNSDFETYVTNSGYTRQNYTYFGLHITQVGTSVGSPSTPVYVDSNGQVQPCTPSSMSVGWASNVNLSKTVNAVSGDSIQAGTGASVTIGNAGNAKTWDSWKIVVDSFGTSTDTIYFY